jgi:hypothetical protein
MNPVDDFLKHAGFMDILRGIGRGIGSSLEPLAHGTALPGSERVGRLVGQVGAPALAAAGLAAFSQGASKGLGALTNKFTKARDYKAMLQANPSLAQADASTTQMYFNSLRHVSPSLSKDPLVAGSFVRNMMEMQPETGPAIPIQTTKLLTDAQKSISQARAGHPIAEAFAGGKPMVLQPEQAGPAPREEFPFTSGPPGVSGRFKTQQEAEQFAQHIGVPPAGIRPPRLEREERFGPIEDEGGTSWGLTGETKKHYR